MAEKKIYVTHNYQAGANIKNLKLEDDLPTVVAGGFAYDGEFNVSTGSSWEVVTTDVNTQTLTNKTMDGGLV